MPRTIEQLKRRRKADPGFNVQVLRPTDFLSSIGVREIDPVPLQLDRFYSYVEMFQIDQALAD